MLRALELARLEWLILFPEARRGLQGMRPYLMRWLGT